MPQQPSAQSNAPTRLPMQIAQGESPAPTETHTATAAEEKPEKHSPGEMPNPQLLFMNSLLSVLLLIAFALAARRRLAAIPRGFQNFAEHIVETLERNFTLGIIGPHGRKYTPLVGTVFLYIFLMNLLSLIPGFHSPTSNLTFTLAMGFVVFIYAQYEGIRSNGVIGYFKHFAGPMPMLAPLMFPIELISEYIKPFTLAIRLFGNIFGEDVILIILAGLTTALLPPAVSKYVSWIPLQVPVLFLATLTAFVQAMVFTILTCIYISLMTHHEEHSEGEAHDEARSHATGH